MTVNKVSVKTAATLQKIQSARMVSGMLWPRSGYVSSSWELSPEKKEEARALVKRAAPAIDGDTAQAFVDAVRWAVIDLHMSREKGVTIKQALASLQAIGEAARALAEAWSNAPDAVRAAMSTHFSRLKRIAANSPLVTDSSSIITDLPTLVADMTASRILFDRAERFMDDEAWQIAGGIGSLIRALHACNARSSPFVHAYVWALAEAWRTATGHLPTFTGNKSAASGGQRLPFQKLLDAVTPRPPPGSPPIGDRIVREVVETFRIGDTMRPITGQTNHQRTR